MTACVHAYTTPILYALCYLYALSHQGCMCAYVAYSIPSMLGYISGITTVSMYGVPERMYINMKEAMYMSPSAQRSSGVMYITIHPYMLCPYVQCTLLHLLMYDTHIIVWRGVSSLHSSAYHLREIWSRDCKEISGLRICQGHRSGPPDGLVSVVHTSYLVLHHIAYKYRGYTTSSMSTY